MAAKLLEGKFFADAIKDNVKTQVSELAAEYSFAPGLAVVIVGDNPASKVYVANKHRACAAVGIHSLNIELPSNTTKEELLAKIDELNADADIHGILVQLPLPEQIAAAEAEILQRIDPLKDVDGFHPYNVGLLSIGQERLVPCTPLGCIRMLEIAGIKLDGQRAVIIGRSNIVGKPMYNLLLARNATVTICHSHTHNLAEVTKTADILVAAVGKPNFVKADMVKPGATVIDVGINRLANRKLVGDVDFAEVQEVAGAITPVPGGVGLLTIAMLMDNTIKAAKLQLLKRSI